MGNFIHTHLLKMQWLDTAIGSILSLLGIDRQSRFGGSIHFFLYDTVKISLLLIILIFIISYIQSYFPPERSKKIMGRCNGLGARGIAALLGTVTPFCSCSSIPIFMSFTKAGLPVGVTFSFLISSPMVDLGSLVLLMSVFGWKVAAAYVVLGLVIAVAGGTIIEHLNMEDQVADFIKKGKTAVAADMVLSQKERFSGAFYAVVGTLKKVFPYILAGVGIGAFIHNWIPEYAIIQVLGEKNPLGVVLAVFAGVPMYADIFGCIPIAESLLAKGALLGVVLSFMMAVTTLSLPSLLMLKQAVKSKLLAVFAGICITGIILVGYVFNIFAAWFL